MPAEHQSLEAADIATIKRLRLRAEDCERHLTEALARITLLESQRWYKAPWSTRSMGERVQ